MNSSSDFDKYDEPRLHMERLLRSRLIELDIPIRVLVPLESVGIHTLGDLVQRTRTDLIGIHNLGRKSRKMLYSILDSINLPLAKRGPLRIATRKGVGK